MLQQAAQFRFPTACRTLAVALLLCLPLPAISQTANREDSRISSLLESLARVRTPATVDISPDGTLLAWDFTGSNGSELHLTRLAPDGSRQSSDDRILSPDTIQNATNNHPGLCASSHPAWSPDGKQLAFLSFCNGDGASFHSDDRQNIFVWTLAGNSMKQVSHLHGEISDLQWSPDGKSIAFLFVENATRRAGATDAMKPWNGVYGEDSVEVQTVSVIQGLDKGGNIAVSLSPKSLERQPSLHIAQLHAYEFAWAPNSTHITFVGAPAPGENNWWIANLYTVAMPTWKGDSVWQDTPKVVFNPATTPGSLHGLQIAVPRFSPDGKQIAFIGGLMSDQGSVGGDIYLIPATGLKSGEQPTDITPNRPASPAWIAWLDNTTLGVSERAGGSTHLTALDMNWGAGAHTGPGSVTATDDPNISLTLPETIVAGFDVFSVSTSHTDNVAFIRQSFEHPPEVWAGPLKHLQQISHLNDSLKPTWGRAESIDYTNEGFHVQGWLLYPAGWSPNDGDPAKKYPLIVSAHGGPSNAAMPRWPIEAYGPVPFSALGYFVFEPNPRGSFGQGEKFTQANVKDFGYGDLRDVLAGVDLVEKRFPIDRDREGITGWSYGGFLTMFAVTQTTRFKAAIAGAGISNWQSYYGENSIDQWLIPFFGASVYDDPAIYARSSAINFIKRAKTPTLLVVGDRDGECPAPQSFEFWHALRDQGVKTQLVLYPNEGHHFSDPDHQRDVLKRALDWFETQMPANSSGEIPSK